MIYYQPTDFTIVNNFLTNGELQYTPDGSTKINLIPIITSSQDKLLKVTRNQEFDFFDINSNCHIYGKLQLGNYPDVEYSLNAVIIAEGVTSGATALNTAALLTMTTTTIPGINLTITGLEVDVADLETAVALLENKTQKISYSNFDNTTTISAITSIYNLKVGNLESGLLQTENLNVRFIGVTEIRNDFIVTNGFGADIDGGINQLHADAVSTFAGALTVNNNFTSAGDDTNINSDNCTITGLTTIRLNSTNPILNVVLPSTVGSFNAQGILIGKEQTNGQARNCNIGYNYDSDGSVNNYGYLGLNVMAGAGNLKESFRWFPSGCAIPTGNLTIATGDLTVTAGNVSVPAGNITLTNGNVALTNGDLSILSGDAFLTSGTLSLTNGDCNLTNGDINLVSGELKTNTISNQSGTALDINANNINIGTNQGVLGLNTVYIGNALSGTIIYLNGAVSSPYGFNVTGAFSQWT
jgi:putative membrane protein